MLFKRKDSKFWWYKFTEKNGNVVRATTGTEDRQKAQELADKAKAASWDCKMLGTKPKRSWEETVLRWISESNKRSLSTDKSHLRFLMP
jgi:hypothetical protein